MLHWRVKVIQVVFIKRLLKSRKLPVNEFKIINRKEKVFLPLKVHSAHISQGRHDDICNRSKSVR